MREASSPSLGDVADVVNPVLDAPVTLDPGGEQPGVGLAVGQRGDRVDDLDRGPPGALLAALSDHPDRPGTVREQRRLRGAGQVEDLDRARLGAAVPDVAVAQPGCL